MVLVCCQISITMEVQLHHHPMTSLFLIVKKYTKCIIVLLRLAPCIGSRDHLIETQFRPHRTEVVISQLLPQVHRANRQKRQNHNQDHSDTPQGHPTPSQWVLKPPALFTVCPHNSLRWSLTVKVTFPHRTRAANQVGKDGGDDKQNQPGAGKSGRRPERQTRYTRILKHTHTHRKNLQQIKVHCE